MSDLPLTKSRKLTKDEKLAEGQKLSRAYKQWHREQLANALTGANGAVVAELLTLLEQLELNSAAVLLDTVQRTAWNEISYDTRLTVLHQINQAIARLRERNGLPAIDDPLPGQPENVFRRIRATLFPSSPANAGSSTRRVSHGVTVAKASNDDR
jgi:hypothetical protein